MLGTELSPLSGEEDFCCSTLLLVLTWGQLKALLCVTPNSGWIHEITIYFNIEFTF